MNNKRIGSKFEQKVCELLAHKGYWVHFIAPDARGAQPFDVIAVKNGIAYAIDCKTCVAKFFNLSRLEQNQIMAFEKWIRCGNENALIVIEHDARIYCVTYGCLVEYEKVRLVYEKNNNDNKCMLFDDIFS